MENEALTSRSNVTFLQPGQARRQVGKTHFLCPKQSLFSVRLHRESTYKCYLPQSKGVSQASPGDGALPHLASLAFSGVRGPGRTESPLLRQAAAWMQVSKVQKPACGHQIRSPGAVGTGASLVLPRSVTPPTGPTWPESRMGSRTSAHK